MYGRQPTLPFDHQHDNVSLDQNPTHVERLKNYLSSVNQLAKQNIMNNQRRYKQRYDINRSDFSYKNGEIVLIKTLNPRSKFDLRYEGPFRITRQLGPKTFIVQHVKKLTLHRQVTSDVMMPIFERNY